MNKANYSEPSPEGKEKNSVLPALDLFTPRFQGCMQTATLLNDVFNASMGLLGVTEILLADDIRGYEHGHALTDSQIYKLMVASNSLAHFVNEKLDRVADIFNEDEVLHG